jgi:Flp pilus assembly pilin Flp
MFAVFGSARRILGLLRVLDERGVTSAEYALMATLITVVISGAVTVFGLAVKNLFSGIIGAF